VLHIPHTQSNSHTYAHIHTHTIAHAHTLTHTDLAKGANMHRTSTVPALCRHNTLAHGNTLQHIGVSAERQLVSFCLQSCTATHLLHCSTLCLYMYTCRKAPISIALPPLLPSADGPAPASGSEPDDEDELWSAMKI